MEIGAAVEHRKYGKGVVKALRQSGFECQVQFASQVLLWVRASQVTVTGSAKQRPPDSNVPLAPAVEKHEKAAPISVTSAARPHAFDSQQLPKTPHRTDSQASRTDNKALALQPPRDVSRTPVNKFVARQMVECLRMGVVSENHASRFTLGRETVIDELCDRLLEPVSSPIVLAGEYGCGKTHVLDYLYGIVGERHGFAVARCSLDVNEVCMHQPKNVYRELVKTFRFTDRENDRVLGFSDFLKHSSVQRILKDHSYFGVVDSDHIEAEVLHWISGQEDSVRPWVSVGQGFKYLPPLYPFQNSGNIYMNLLTGLSFACKKVGGRGLILLFDEAEFLNGPFPAGQLIRGKNFLDAIARCVKEDKVMTGRPYTTGLDFTRRARDTPYLYRTGVDLKAVFAFADPAVANVSNELKSAHWINLEPLDRSLYDTAFVEIKALYNEAYSTAFSADEEEIQDRWKRIRKLTGSPRLFFKGCVEVFDLARAKLQNGLAQ